MKPSRIGKAALALAVIAGIAGTAALPARADDRDHERRDYREHDYRGHDYREHERDRHRDRDRYAYVPPPAYVEAPPPVIYAPPPTSFGLNLIFPLQFR
jgi:hypothetical protein